VTKTLRNGNDKLIRLYPGESIELKFLMPKPPALGNKLSYVLYSKGYYIPIKKITELAKVGAWV
jgi:hypothetical protein